MPGLRPLALIAVLLAGMFALKSVSLADGAIALVSAASAFELDAQAAAAAEDVAEEPDARNADDSPFRPAAARSGAQQEAERERTASELDIITSLSRRRAELDLREADLDTRAALLQVAEERIETRIARLEALQSTLEELLGQLDSERARRVGEIVQVYAQLEPENAAAIMSRMDDETLLLLAEQLQREQGRRYAAILAEMEPGFAAELTLRLRARASPPQTQAEVEARLAGTDS